MTLEKMDQRKVMNGNAFLAGPAITVAGFVTLISEDETAAMIIKKTSREALSRTKITKTQKNVREKRCHGQK